MFVHISLQSIGIIGILVFVAVIIPEITSLDRSHTIIGLSLLSLLTIQLIIGVGNTMGLKYDQEIRTRSKIRRIHQIIGLIITLLSIIQVYFGLDIMYPLVGSFPLSNAAFAPRNYQAVWIVYFCVISFLVIFFIAMEIFMYLKRRDSLNSAKKATPGSSVVINNASTASLVETRLASAPRRDTFLKNYTWKTLGEDILAGKLLVVANCKYVYDVSKWITSHPGGQIIMYMAVGTDITNDYFLESGYDAESFTPQRLKEKIDRNSTNLKAPLQREGSFTNPSGSVTSIDDIDSSLNGLSGDDYKSLIKARRTHVHTRTAVRKLAELLVGELSLPALNTPAINTTSNPKSFDRFEYRRYALIGKTLLTGTTDTPVYLLRFCLLYPYDVREGEPAKIFPGECVEIQSRIGNDWVSRYYTPVGNLQNFEITIKRQKGGIFSGFLADQIVGNRQFKIRGLFGDPLIHPNQRISVGPRWVPERIYFICAVFKIDLGIWIFSLLAISLVPLSSCWRAINVRLINSGSLQVFQELDLMKSI